MSLARPDAALGLAAKAGSGVEPQVLPLVASYYQGNGRCRRPLDPCPELRNPAKSATDSDAIRPPIPTEVGHPFR